MTPEEKQASADDVADAIVTVLERLSADNARLLAVARAAREFGRAGDGQKYTEAYRTMMLALDAAADLIGPAGKDGGTC